MMERSSGSYSGGGHSHLGAEGAEAITQGEATESMVELYSHLPADTRLKISQNV